MFAPISVLLAGIFLLPALPNGIQLAETTPRGDSVEIVAGYASGGVKAFSSISAVRALELAAYAAGGDLKFFNELERTGVRITVPNWAAPMFADQLAALFKEIPAAQTGNSVRNEDFRSKVEGEIRDALIGSVSSQAEYATDQAFVLFPAPIPTRCATASRRSRRALQKRIPRSLSPDFPPRERFVSSRIWRSAASYSLHRRQRFITKSGIPSCSWIV